MGHHRETVFINHDRSNFCFAAVLCMLLALTILLTLEITPQVAYAEGAEHSNNIHEYIANEYNTNSELVYTQEIVPYELNVYEDDPIIKYIPRTLFLMENTTLNIHKDYGYFIHTFRDWSYIGDEALDNMHSFVLVFEISFKVEKKEFETKDRFSYTISPLFQREYFAVMPGGTDNYVTMGFFSNANIKMNDTSWEDFLYATYGLNYLLHYNISSDINIADGVIVPAPQRNDNVSFQCELYYDEINLFNLADITIAANIFNGQDLNESDTGYDVLNDDGNFIIRTGIDISATEFNGEYDFNAAAKDTGYFALKKIVNMVIGWVPIVGSYINNALDVAEFIRGTENHYFGDQFEQVDYSSYYASTVYANSKHSQMELTGGKLCKSSAISTKAMNGVEAWLRVGDCFTGFFEVGGSTGNEPGWYTIAKHSVALSVKCLISDFPTVSEASDFFANDFNELRDKSIFEDVATEAYIRGNDGEMAGKDSFAFTALRNGLYEIVLTNGTSVDYVVTNESDNTAYEPTSGDMYYFAEGQKYIIELSNTTSTLKRPIIKIGMATLKAGVDDSFVLTLPAGVIVGLKVDFEDAFTDITLTGNNTKIYGVTENGFMPNEGRYTTHFDQIGSGIKYLWVENVAGQAQTVTIVFADIQLVMTGTGGIYAFDCVGGDYYTVAKFDLDDSYIYCLELALSTAEASPDFVVYDENGNINTANRMPSADNKHFTYLLNVGSGMGYLAVRGDGTYTVTMSTSGEAGDWYINGELASTYSYDSYGAVIFEQFEGENAEYTVQYITKSGTIVNDLNYIGDNIGIDFNPSSGVVTITPNSPYTRQNIYFTRNGNVVNPLKLTFAVRRGPGFDFEYTRVPLMMKLHYDAESPLDSVTVTAGENTYSFDCAGRNGVIDLSSQIKTDFYDAFVLTATFEVASYTMLYSERTTYTQHPDGHLSDAFAMASYATGVIPYAGGKGLLWDPFQITSRAELEYMGQHDLQLASYILMNDIDLGGANWTPLPTFSGIFGGAGYAIKNMRIHISDTSDSLLRYGFASINKGIISGVNFENACITASNLHYVGWVDVGIVAGYNELTITDCNANGTLEINRNNSNIGGIVGENGGSITNCTLGTLHSSKVMGNGEIGGIAGKNTSSISDCHVHNTEINFWEVYQGRSIGGIVGYNPDGTIMDCGIINSVFIFSGYESGENAWIPNFGYIAGAMEGDSRLIRVAKTDDVTYDFSAVCPNSFVTYIANWFKGYWGETGYRADTVYVE